MDKSTSKAAKNVAIRNECVQVIVRCRPLSSREQNGEYQQVVEVFPNRGVIELNNPSETTRENKMFTYDAAYDAKSTQQNVYDEVIRPLVSSVMEGFNGCVFAYGQTGTGKTYTMEGIRGDPEQKGIIPRAFEQIWSHINRAQNQNFLVAVSYLEIYMEELRDLLKPNTTATLELRERGFGVYVPNLHSVLCKSVDDMLNVMNQGNKNRTTGFTNMNAHSSRSHAIFSIKIEMCEIDDTAVKVGKLNLIDLAGSERQSKSGATAERLKEASKINRALSSLGNVISALAEKSFHVPYRDSKLTRLLQDSLGGNSKTIMIANIGPSEYNYNETLTTLRYANRAKTIQNKPVKNEDPQDTKLREYQEEIARLRQLITERQNREKTLPRRKKSIQTSKIRKRSCDSEKSDSEEEVDGESDDGKNNNSNEKELLAADAETNGALQRERDMTSTLANKLNELEGQLVRGGKNILDTYTERQTELETKLAEIAERKKREIEMQQQLELQEESTTEIRETFTSLQQEVELKTRKLKKCYAKCMALKQEIQDTKDEHNRDRRELEMTQNELIKELKRLLLIIDNFVPVEVKSRLYTQARYDEEQEEWNLCSHLMNENQPNRRPVAIAANRRPMSEFAMNMIKQQASSPQDGVRYKADNIIMHELEMPLRTTYEYKNPKVSASLQAVLAEAMQTEDDIDITDQSYASQMKLRLDRITRRNAQPEPATNNTTVQHRARSSNRMPDTVRTSSAAPKKLASASTNFPKARGLIPK